MKHEHAIAIGQEALIWIAGQPEALSALLAASGLDWAELRARASDAEFLGFVLDHLLAADETVIAFAGDAGLAPEDPARARAALGGALPNWT
jgi:hypothetical protein